MSTVIGPDADWIRFDAVVATSRNQIALTSGELVDSWEKDGRRYFRYQARERILRYLPILSASYEVRKDRWGDVAIEVYYHPGHDFNVGRMIAIARTSLQVFSEKFGSYPYATLRIVEFPRYELSAEAFPGVIPLSEGYGFIARRKEGGVEELARVIAHEVAHQWWGMQTIGAGVEGEFFICETLAQHAALTVLRGEYGESALADYRKTKTDLYLRGRAREESAEVPLARTNFETPYVHYDKGLVVMSALRELMGERALDAAVRAFFQAAARRSAPFPVAEDFIRELFKEAPDGAREAVREMVEEIVLYDNRAKSAEAEEAGGGKYKVTLRFEAAKSRCDERGKETPASFRNEVEFAVFGELGETLFRGRRPVEAGSGAQEFVVDGPPARAGIDPFHLLIDRNPDDNVVAVVNGPRRSPRRTR
jgi:aminopeptidase N